MAFEDDRCCIKGCSRIPSILAVINYDITGEFNPVKLKLCQRHLRWLESKETEDRRVVLSSERLASA